MIKKTLIILFTIILLTNNLFAETSDTDFPDEENGIQIFTEKLINAGQIHQIQRFEPGFPKYHLLNLEGAEKPEVDKFRTLFMTPRYHKILVEALEDSTDYRLYIRKEIEKAGIPLEIEYLPVVESYYRTKAKSPSGALGMWQFMANSVKPYLKLNEYVDERLDPWKETIAAIKKLQENYNRFNDWNLAIGAYNCGAGAMGKAVNNSDYYDFWFLVSNNLIPEQTRLYNPKLIAIADIIINNQYYDSNLNDLTEEYKIYSAKETDDFEYLTVNNAYRLSDLASKMNIDLTLMNKLNPSFLKGYTPPDTQSLIRLPYGTLNTAKKVIQNIDPINIPFKYVIQSGDTLWGISRKHNVTVQEICNLNNIKEDSVLSVGKILYIPSKFPR